MKILIIRHGEPDYKHDSLTEKGWREAECLSEMLCKLDSAHTHYYQSPLGRAQDTASVTLHKLGRTAEVLPWLKEFDIKIRRPDSLLLKKIPWDWLPQDWTQDPRFYQADHWAENERMAAGKVGEEYRKVTEAFDELLAKHGYRREGIAIFRMLSYGEITHLYVKDEEPSFAARFCECYGDDTRHD